MNIYECAILYASIGFRVLPIYAVDTRGQCTCHLGTKCEKGIGKHPYVTTKYKHGLKDATSNISEIRSWRDKIFNANIAIATGTYNNEYCQSLVVLDIDPRSGGNDSLSELLKKYGDMPKTLTARTGGGGVHYLFCVKDKTPRSKVLKPGIDFKAGNAYIVVAPSNHKSGGVYSWVCTKHSSCNCTQEEIVKSLIWDNIAETPKWILDLKRHSDVLIEEDDSKNVHTFANYGYRIPSGGIPEGERDQTLFAYACFLLNKLGANFHAIYSEVREMNNSKCNPPLPDSIVKQKVKSALRYAKIKV